MNIFQPKVTPVILNIEKPILPKKPITSTPIFPSRRKTFVPFKRRRLNTKARKARAKIIDPISKFVECLSRPSVINRLFGVNFDSTELSSVEEGISKSARSFLLKPTLDTMLPSMPSLGTPIKMCSQNEVLSNIITSTENAEDKTVTAATTTNAKNEIRKNALPEISTISSSSFQQADTSAEVEFCRPTDNCQTITSTSNVESSRSVGDVSPTIQEILPNNTPQEKKENEMSTTSLEKVRTHFFP